MPFGKAPPPGGVVATGPAITPRTIGGQPGGYDTAPAAAPRNLGLVAYTQLRRVADASGLCTVLAPIPGQLHLIERIHVTPTGSPIEVYLTNGADRRPVDYFDPGALPQVVLVAEPPILVEEGWTLVVTEADAVTVQLRTLGWA